MMNKKIKLKVILLISIILFFPKLQSDISENLKVGAISLTAGAISGCIPFFIGEKIHESTNYSPYIYTPIFASYITLLEASKFLFKENINDRYLNLASIISAFLTCCYIEESDRSIKNRSENNTSEKIESKKPKCSRNWRKFRNNSDSNEEQ